MKVDMAGFCLVAQPWTYKIIGGPSKLPQDIPWPIPNHSWSLNKDDRQHLMSLCQGLVFAGTVEKFNVNETRCRQTKRC